MLNVKKMIHGFEDIDVDMTLEKIEKLAERLEQFWINTTGLPSFDFDIN